MARTEIKSGFAAAASLTAMLSVVLMFVTDAGGAATTEGPPGDRTANVGGTGDGGPIPVTLAVGDTSTLTYPESATVRVSRRGIVDVFHAGGDAWTMSALRGGVVLVEATDAVSGEVLRPRMMVTVQPRDTEVATALPPWLCAESGITCRRDTGEVRGKTTAWDWYAKAKRACDALNDCLFRVVLSGSDAAYRLEAHIFLVEEATARRLGFDGKIELAASTGPESLSASLLTRLESLDTERDVHVVGRPVVRMLPGKTVEVLSGGEFQIAEPDGDGDGWRAAWKQTGLSLTVEATPIGRRIARLHVKGSLKSRQAGEQAALSVSSVDSHFDVRLGRPTLAAALDLESRESSSRGTLLRDLPILGPLFRSSGKAQSRSRLLVWLELDSDGS